MTYKELYENATKKLDKGEITLGEYEEMIKPLEEEVRMWTPVSENLPEKEDLYLVSVKNDHERRYSKTCWFHGDGNWFARQDVEAWMLLPESYKGE